MNRNTRKDDEPRLILTEDRVKGLLKEYGIPTPSFAVIENEQSIAQLQLSYPAALKICSKAILHKTDVGGVLLDIKDREHLVEALREMRDRFPGERFLVEPMADDGLELIVGVIRDTTFGLCLMVGLGGVLTEVLGDASFRKLPISRLDAERMLSDLKGARLLDGYRGRRVDKESIIELLIRVSDLAISNKDWLDELDLNPVLVHPNGLTVVDGKAIGRSTPLSPHERARTQRSRKGMTSLLYPESIAIIGASANPSKRGYLLVQNLLAGGYEGRILPVNPKGGEILGLKVHRSVGEIEGAPDLALVVVGVEQVTAVVEECASSGVPSLIIYSSGFGELGSEGNAIESNLGELLLKDGIRALGPNCQGLVNVRLKMAAAFDIETLVSQFKPGRMAIVSQSGSVGSNFVQSVVREQLGFSIWVNLGNKVNVDEADLVSRLNEDSNVHVIAMHLEDIKDGDRFVAAIAKLKKPLVLLKAGRTKAGQKAAQSHTAALAGNDAILNGVLRQHGVLRVTSTEELFDLTKALSVYPPFTGRRILIVESSGGLGTIAADIAEDVGIELPELNEETKAQLTEILPPYLAPNNPLDLAAVDSEPYEAVAGTGATETMDAVLLLFGDPVVNASRAAEAFLRKTNKPVLVMLSGGGEIEEREAQRCAGLGIPVFPSVERAMTYFRYRW